MLTATLGPTISWSYNNWLLAPITYDGIVTVTSQQTADVALVIGEVSRHRADADVLPAAIANHSWAARHPNLSGTFDEADQRVFLESFRSELERLNLFSHAVIAQEAPTNGNAHIKLWFAKTDYFHETQRYVLCVEMKIDGGGDTRTWRYTADSSHGISFVKAMFTK